MRIFIGFAALLLTLSMAACSPEDIGAPAAGTVLVDIKENFFEPATVTVAQGTRVRWTNRGNSVHTVVVDDLPASSNALHPSFWFEAQFDDAGTFEYHCSLHPEETGTVIVQ